MGIKDMIYLLFVFGLLSIVSSSFHLFKKVSKKVSGGNMVKPKRKSSFIEVSPQARDYFVMCRQGREKISQTLRKLSIRYLRTQQNFALVRTLESIMSEYFDKMDGDTLKKVVKFIILPRVDKGGAC